MRQEHHVRSFGALADPVRCRVVEQLSAGPVSAGELAHRTGTSPSSMSRHLKVLLEASLVTDRRSPSDARVRVFQLEADALAETGAWLDRVRSHWQANLASFQSHVERSGA